MYMRKLNIVMEYKVNTETGTEKKRLTHLPVLLVKEGPGLAGRP